MNFVTRMETAFRSKQEASKEPEIKASLFF